MVLYGLTLRVKLRCWRGGGQLPSSSRLCLAQWFSAGILETIKKNLDIVHLSFVYLIVFIITTTIA